MKNFKFHGFFYPVWLFLDMVWLFFQEMSGNPEANYRNSLIPT